MDVYQIVRTHIGVWSWREVVGFILVLYLGIVFASTIFTRTTGARRYELVPFWSWYEMITTGNLGLFEWDDMIHNGIGCMAGCVVGDWVWGRLLKRALLNR